MSKNVRNRVEKFVFRKTKSTITYTIPTSLIVCYGHLDKYNLIIILTLLFIKEEYNYL